MTKNLLNIYTRYFCISEYLCSTAPCGLTPLFPHNPSFLHTCQHCVCLTRISPLGCRRNVISSYCILHIIYDCDGSKSTCLDKTPPPSPPHVNCKNYFFKDYRWGFVKHGSILCLVPKSS